MQKESLNGCHPECNEGSCHTTTIPDKILQAKSLCITGESGRTMVEMLGVLAIIGILSIGGIMGFRYAMNKHYANETVERLNERATVIASQRLNGQNANIDDFNPNDGIYPIPNVVEIQDAESFYLTVNEVPMKICQQIKLLDWRTAKMIPEDCSNTTLKFRFLNDLADCSDCLADSVDCDQYSDDCGTCSATKGYEGKDSECEGNEKGAYCVRGECSKCKDGEYWGSYSRRCLPCSGIGGYQCAQSDQAHRCLEQGFYVGYHWQCGTAMIDCSYGDDWGRAESEGCKACPNRCYNVADSTCRLFGEDKDFLKNEDGTCRCNPREDTYEYNGVCYYCPTGTFFNSNTCRQCSAIGTYKCARSDQAHRCLEQGFYVGYHWQCGTAMIDCTYGDSWGRAESEGCKACPNRCYNVADSTCRLFGEDKDFLKNEDGTCRCNPREDTYEYNGVCYYRPENTFFDSYGKTVRNCDALTSANCAKSDQAHRCLGKGFYVGYHGSCGTAMIACSYGDSWGRAESEGCKACANRCYLNGTCYLAGDGYAHQRVSPDDGTCQQ